MPELSGSNYSELDAGNNNPAPNGMPEGMAASGVNDAWRASMGAVKRSYDRDHGGSWVTVGGTANAITLSYLNSPSSYVVGEKYTFVATGNNTTATTIAVGGLSALTLNKRSANGPIATVGNEIKTGDVIEVVVTSGTTALILNPASNGMMQVVTNETGAYIADTTANMPGNVDTAPVNTNGTQVLTATITPSNTASTLIFDVTVFAAFNTVGFLQAALFQTGTATAIACCQPINNGNNNVAVCLNFRHKMTAGSTSALTFTVRAGCDRAGTVGINGTIGARVGAGTVASSLIITEYPPF